MSEITNPLYGKFEQVVDAFAGAPVVPVVESWDILVSDVLGDPDICLDAGSYAPEIATAMDDVATRCDRLEPLGSLATVSLGKWFSRVFTDDPDEGIPYVNATDLVSLMAFGVPADKMRYLAPATKTDITSLLVREGSLLMTCSGSVSRVFYVGRRLDGWVATHDIIRIVPHDEAMVGYLYAWLSSPAAKAGIQGRQHGGVVKHVTDKHVAESPVPRLGREAEAEISKRVTASLMERERAIEKLAEAWPP